MHDSDQSHSFIDDVGLSWADPSRRYLQAKRRHRGNGLTLDLAVDPPTYAASDQYGVALNLQIDYQIRHGTFRGRLVE